jgi:hypothetical protein
LNADTPSRKMLKHLCRHSNSSIIEPGINKLALHLIPSVAAVVVFVVVVAAYF